MNDSSHASKARAVIGEVTFLPQNLKVPVLRGDLTGSLLDFAWRNKVKIATSCGGGGSCGACRILVVSALATEPRNEVEQSMADDRGFATHERLSCQISPQAGMTVEIPD